MNVSLAVPKRIPVTDMLWTVVFFQVAMGGVDTLYHHELTERLTWRPSQTGELGFPWSSQSRV